MHLRIIQLFTIIILSFTSPLYAYDGITYYGAEISSRDRYNTNGERLNSVRDILRQDRANFHRYGITDRADQNDNFFASKRNREIFDTARINVSPSLTQRIKGNRPVYITVFVLTRDQIDVSPGLPNPNVD